MPDKTHWYGDQTDKSFNLSFDSLESALYVLNNIPYFLRISWISFVSTN